MVAVPVADDIKPAMELHAVEVILDDARGATELFRELLGKVGSVADLGTGRAVSRLARSRRRQNCQRVEPAVSSAVPTAVAVRGLTS
jgi:hypothetical protein